jgi:HEAT repeat protein
VTAAHVKALVRKEGSKQQCNDLVGCRMITTLTALGRNGAPAVEDAFASSSGDGHWRLSLLTALGRMGHPGSGPFLEEIARAEEPEAVRTAAVMALARLRPKAQRESLFLYSGTLDAQTDLPLLLALAYAVAAMGDERGNALIREHLVTPEAQKPHHFDRLRPGVIAVGRLRMQDMRDRIETIAQSGGPYMRREAAIALGRIRVLDAAPTLIHLLSDVVPGVRDEAQAALVALTGYKHKTRPEQWSRWWADRSAKKSEN